MFNDDTNDDYYRVTTAGVRGIMMLRIIVTVIVDIKEDQRKVGGSCKVPYFNYYYCACNVSNVQCVTFFQ